MDFSKAIAEFTANYGGIETLSTADAAALINMPPNTAMGDYCLPCFTLAKTLRLPPLKIADNIVKALNSCELPGFLLRVEAVAGYVNYYLNREILAREVMESFAKGVPASDVGAGKTICIDYSSINIAKPFHMGHLSTTVLGGSLYRIFRHLGYKVVGINHLGDYGTQFGKLITAYKLWGSESELDERGLSALLEWYVKYHELEKTDTTLGDTARSWSKKITDGDGFAVNVYNKFKEVTLGEINKVYDRLGVKFDSYKGESYFLGMVDGVVDELKRKNLLTMSDGAQVVSLEEDGMPPCLILRKDGASLYATRDIAAALYRHETYGFDKCLYVVAYQQNLHFRQFFRVIEKMGHEWAKDLVHVPFGMVSMADGTLSTREGKVVFLAEVLDKAVEKTLSIISAKNPSADMDKIAEKVGVGAVIFSALSSSRIKDIVFSWDKTLNFDGETGPYLQYTHARCCSVLNKGGVDYNSAIDLKGVDYSIFQDDNTVTLLKQVMSLPQAIEYAAREYEPSVIARHIIDIAKSFNKFYFDHKILDGDEVLRTSRMALVKVVKDCLKLGLELILLYPVEKM